MEVVSPEGESYLEALALFSFSFSIRGRLLLPALPSAPELPLPNSVVVLVALGMIPYLFSALVRPVFFMFLLLRTQVCVFTKRGPWDQP